MRKVMRYRMKDVGRKGHHYLEIAVRTGVGPRGGKTTGKLVTKADLQKRVKKMIASRWKK